MKNTISNLMPSVLIALAIVIGFSFRTAEHQSTTAVYEYKQFSTIESIVPGGLGRSRVLTTDDKGTVVEKDLMNFYSLVGINFGNIATNDRTIVDKLNEWTSSGWELYQVTTGSSTSTMQGNTNNGIFITRYLFRKAKN